MGKQKQNKNDSSSQAKQDGPAKDGPGKNDMDKDNKTQDKGAGKGNFRDYVIGLARKSIAHFFEAREFLKVPNEEIPFSELKKESGCFVTLTINNQLRGCVGNIEPHGKLYEAIIRNAV